MTYDDTVYRLPSAQMASMWSQAVRIILSRVWIWQPDDLIAQMLVCISYRNLTRAEWKQYIGDALPYQAVCPNLPIEPEITITPTP